MEPLCRLFVAPILDAKCLKELTAVGRVPMGGGGGGVDLALSLKRLWHRKGLTLLS